MQERLALNLARWRDKNKPQILADFTSALIENREASLDSRINTFSLVFNNLEKLAGGLRRETDQDKLENEAVADLINWARENETGTAIWISPPSEEYSESRFIIYSLTTENNQRIITFRAICGKHDSRFCIFTSRQLVAFSPLKIHPPNSPDDLRRTLIPFDPKPYSDWISLMEDLFGKSTIWEKIRNGEDIKQRREAEKISGKIIGQHLGEVYRASDHFQRLVVGARLEYEASKYGIRIQQNGSCGISNMAALNSFNSDGPFTILHSGNIKAESVKTLRCTCPFCHSQVSATISGGRIHCPNCGKSAEYAC